MDKTKLIFWAPRIVTILFLLFLAMFSFDVFSEGYGFWETVIAFSMHNLPVVILLAVLIIAWRHDIVGSIVFITAGLFYIFIAFSWESGLETLIPIAIISGPAFLIAGLFYLSWRERK